MNQSYDLDVFDHHLIINVGQLHVLIDTGSPVTLSNNGIFEFMGKQFPAQKSIAGKSIDDISGQVGRCVDVLLGMDVLKNFVLRIDLDKNTILFSDVDAPEEDSIPMTVRMGIPTINMTVDGGSYTFILDTGAKISYIESNITHCDTPIATLNDFNPLLGDFTTPIYAKDVKIGTKTFTCQFGNLPFMAEKALSVSGFNGIIGYDIFQSYIVTLDFINGIISLMNK